jgi:hypothetical protein
VTAKVTLRLTPLQLEALLDAAGVGYDAWEADDDANVERGYPREHGQDLPRVLAALRAGHGVLAQSRGSITSG